MSSDAQDSGFKGVLGVEHEWAEDGRARHCGSDARSAPRVESLPWPGKNQVSSGNRPKI